MQQGLPDVDALDVWPLLSGESTEPVRTELLLQYPRFGTNGRLTPEVARYVGGPPRPPAVQAIYTAA